MAISLEKKLGCKISDFAFPFGGFSSISSEAIAIARRRYRFIYTNMRGVNLDLSHSWAIRRDSLSPSDSNGCVGSLLEGAADILYAKQLRKYEEMGASLACFKP